MVDVKDLEQRWIRYKIKKYTPYAIGGAGVIVLALIAMFVSFPTKEETTTKDKKTIQQTQPKQQQQVLQQPKTPQPIQQKQPPVIVQQPYQVPTPQQTSEQNILKPSMEFLHKLEKTTVYPQYIPQEPKRTYSKPKPKPKKAHKPYKKRVTTKPKKQHFADIQPATIEVQAPLEEKRERKITIKTTKTSQKELQEITQRFKKTNNPVLSLFLAREYYKRGNYRQSYNYALITNQIDSTIEDSWIIFAKSLVKLKQKNKAIKILQTYIRSSHSKKAQILLDNILTGKFR